MADLVVIAPIALVDGQGNSLVPVTPVDGCDHPLPNLLRALRRVRWHVVSVHRVRQLVSAAALAAGCDMQWKNEFAGAPGSHFSPGGRVFASAPKTVRVCVYRTPAAQSEVGTFVRGLRLDGSQTRRLLEALRGPGPKRRCPDERVFAVVLAHPGLGATVEMGGCWRVLRPYPHDGIGGANGAAVKAALGRG